jgi:hypothetical protein
MASALAQVAIESRNQIGCALALEIDPFNR